MGLFVIGLIMVAIYFLAKYLMLDITRPVVYDILRALQIIGYIFILAGLASFLTPYK